MNFCSNADERYINFAIEEAYKSNVGFRHGCVAVASGKIIARGYNSDRTISRDGLIGKMCSCHAEIDVLRKCLKRKLPKKISLYIVRITLDNRITSSMPCIECYKQMNKFSIRSIIYSDYGGNIIKTPKNDFKTTHISSGSKALQNNRILPLNII